MTIFTASLRAMAAALLLAGTAHAAGEEVAPPPVPAERPYMIDWDAKVPMRDGVTLAARIYRPMHQEGKLPVILSMTPYNVDRFHEVGVYFAEHGYIFASVDSRGRGNSGGDFVPWFREAEDGYDLVEWLAAQPWSNGHVGSWGGSYGGKNQWAWAALKPPHLRSIVPASSGLVGYDVGLYRNIGQPGQAIFMAMVHGRTMNANLTADRRYWFGALNELSRGTLSFRDFAKTIGVPGDFINEGPKHPTPDAYWEAAGPKPNEWAGIDIPVLSITGMYDDAQLGTLEFRRRHLAAVDPKVGAQEYLVMGPWQHSGTRIPVRHVGGVDFGAESVIDVRKLHVDWFNWVMEGGPRPDFLKDRFVYYITGSNRWASARDLEAATKSVETLHLASPATSATSVAKAGTLTGKPAAGGYDEYVDDPAAPAFAQSYAAQEAAGPKWLSDAGPTERIDGDGLIYETAPFAKARDLVGRPRLKLWVSMDTPDADLRAELFEVKPDGSVIYLTEDRIRTRYRNSETRAEPMAPGKLAMLDFDRFYWVGRTVASGNRLRLVISPVGKSIYNERNRNSGGEVAAETAKDNRAAHVRIWSGKMKSVLELPFGG